MLRAGHAAGITVGILLVRRIERVELVYSSVIVVILGSNKPAHGAKR
jgi:hypothetical protein